MAYIFYKMYLLRNHFFNQKRLIEKVSVTTCIINKVRELSADICRLISMSIDYDQTSDKSALQS